VISEVFDELIRQVTLEQPERGYLLVRVREEIRLTINAHLEMHRSTLAFGQEKLNIAESSARDMVGVIAELTERKKKLQNRVLELEQKVLAVEEENQTFRIDRDRAHVKKKGKLITQANTLQRFIDQHTEKGEKESKKDSGGDKEKESSDEDEDEEEDTFE